MSGAHGKHTPGPWALRRHGVIVGGEFHTYPNGASQSQLAMVTILSKSNAPNIEAERDANARLIAAAPDLLGAQTMGAELSTPDFLEWIADRLVHVHGENPNVDYVLSLRERAKAGRAATAKATGETP